MPVDPLTAALPTPLEEIAAPWLEDSEVRLLLKREDLIHPLLPGNKWRKLRYNLETARTQGHDTLLTFGGAYSNHIRAVAAAGKLAGFATIGVIRGEAHDPLNPSLQFAHDQGMQLTYLDRATYRRKHEPDVIDALNTEFKDCYLIPEGGSNALAVKGCAEIPGEIASDYDLICCPVGTAGTLAGIATGLPEGKRALGFSALKGGHFLHDQTARLQLAATGQVRNNWSIATEFHCGGYAKRNRELEEFINSFAEEHGIILEWVYVAKMLYGIRSMTKAGAFSPGTTIIALITG
ncbi:1-aminocyclopropane-1-carboxylate deaminase/D-cysteine desulfhydrase [Natronoglycomyces albus]|uniref:Pyridoxal-phosphate dependent enzyme n=1 Tax=Natronoglycomyces albus TaxID=2811108 RepID=A0A895XJQ4_9ACTN|nr:pyridoxal-phosphate dependent enzyme [Natronoglycomyces albus]QSB04042.1 pyridoxal-phosphate dependent enzyme [Natronoglycomyces albus]